MVGGGFMGRFEKLNDDIRLLAEKMLVNQDLCRLIHYSDINPLSADLSDVNGKKDVMDKRLILFSPKLPTGKEVGTFVNIRPVSMRASQGDYYIKTRLRFCIFCHKDASVIYYKDNEGETKKGNRAMLILDRITNFMEDVDIGIGKENIGGIEEICNRDSSFAGYMIDYLNVDFRK